MDQVVPSRGDSGTPAQPSKLASAVILSSDAASCRLLQPALDSVAIYSETCATTDDFLQLIRSNRYELACIDFNLGDQAVHAVSALRSSPSNRTAIIIGITVNSEQSNRALGCGVHFVLLQPISRSSIDSIIRAAYGLIIRERRRYFRCPIDVRIVAHRRTEAAWVGRTVNVSEDGLCIAAPVQLTPGDLVELEFKLPQSSLEIGAEARVQWCNQTGRAGLRFLRLEHDARSDLQHWLTEQLNKILKPTLARVDLNRTHQETFLAKLY